MDIFYEIVFLRSRNKIFESNFKYNSVESIA